MFEQKVKSLLWHAIVVGPFNKDSLCFECDIPLSYLLRNGYMHEHEGLCVATKEGKKWIMS